MAESAAWTGILLAAGRGRRFDPGGQQSKLLMPWDQHNSVAVSCAIRLLQAFPLSIAVLRPDQQELQRQLADAGCAIVLTEQADLGMAIACALPCCRLSTVLAGWWHWPICPV